MCGVEVVQHDKTLECDAKVKTNTSLFTYAICFAGTSGVPMIPGSGTIEVKSTLASNYLMAATSSWMSSKEYDFSDMLGYAVCVRRRRGIRKGIWSIFVECRVGNVAERNRTLET